VRVLILGGTGVFGSRLCRLLAGDPGLTLTIAARDRAAVDALARALGVSGRAFDWRSGLDAVLGEGGHDVVVHAAGPFQEQDYGVAECCIRHGVHYLDLADDAAFVQGIDRLHDAALKAGVLVCAGASTAPALTGAVVEEGLKAGPIERVAFGIMPGNDAPRGPALVATILGGAGETIAGQPGRRVWGDLRRMRLPGLGKRWVAPCDLPEPALFARRFAIPDTFAGASLEVSLFHVGLWSLSWLVRLGLVRTLTPAAPALAGIADRLRFLGTDRGGLRLELHAGAQSRVWCVIAEGGDGPFIPVTPAAALVRKLAGGLLMRGAVPCLGVLTLPEIEAEWRRAGLRIAASWNDGDLRPTLYRRVLGGAYDRQSSAGQKLHDAGPSHWTGRCTVTGAQSLAGRAMAWLFQLPAATADAPITVEFTASGTGELWTRRIGGWVMRSRQFIGLRRPAGWLVERFGILDFDLLVQVADGRLTLSMRGMRCCGLPLPRALWPMIEATETEEQGRFRFDVQIGLPLMGRLVRYRGWLTSP
jgi:NAD(P)-dependent dehydrogenase (short-subunit alcohol dehydrogenase family)